MNRAQIISRFREENPEITANVVSDAVLKSWLLIGDKEICAKDRLIVETGSFNCVANEDQYDLTTLLEKFFDIDEYPGGGVSIVISSGNEKRIPKRTKSDLDIMRPRWRTDSAATPKDYYRRSKYLHFAPTPISAFVVNIDFVAISDDFDDDNKLPFNQITAYEPFHYGLVQYLRMKAKSKVGKPEDAQNAMNEYNAYVEWIKKEVGGGKYGPINFRPAGVTPYKGYR